MLRACIDSSARAGLVQPTHELERIYSYCEGQTSDNLPDAWTAGLVRNHAFEDASDLASFSCVTLQAPGVLRDVAHKVLTLLSGCHGRSAGSSLNELVADPIFEAGQKPSSILDAIHYLGDNDVYKGVGCQPQVDKGLLSVIFASTAAGLQVSLKFVMAKLMNH